MSREFDGEDGSGLECSIGALSGFTGSNCTYLFCWRPMDVKPMGIIGGVNVSDGIRWNVNPYTDGKIYCAAADNFQSSNPDLYSSSDGWRLDGFTVSSGATNVRWHSLNKTTPTGWTHADKGAISVASTDAVKLWIAKFNNTQAMRGRFAALAVWSSPLSDGAIESCENDFYVWMKLSPAAAWLFNQESTSLPILDLTGGGANQVSVVGSSVSTDEPPHFNYSRHPSAMLQII
jgi:hypothetical protein